MQNSKTEIFKISSKFSSSKLQINEGIKVIIAYEKAYIIFHLFLMSKNLIYLFIMSKTNPFRKTIGNGISKKRNYS